jgi:hypothetical protein
MKLRLPDHRLASLISEAAFDSSKWTQVCDGMAELIGGCGSVMFPLGPDLALLDLPHSDSLEESFQRYIKDEWYTRDLRFGSIETCRKRGYVTDADYISYEDVNSSEYYQEFLRPVKLKWFAGLGVGEGSDCWVFSVQQSLDKDPFKNDDIKKLFAYRELLNNSATISRQLGFAKIIGATTIMEHHGRAVVALGVGGRVLHVSSLAQNQIGKAFQIVQGQLRARFEKDRLPLERLITSLCNNQIFKPPYSSVTWPRFGTPSGLWHCTSRARARDFFSCNGFACNY